LSHAEPAVSGKDEILVQRNVIVAHASTEGFRGVACGVRLMLRDKNNSNLASAIIWMVNHESTTRRESSVGKAARMMTTDEALALPPQ
jgi:hypothetical protein